MITANTSSTSLNPKYKEAMYKEARDRRIDADRAWDVTMWYDLETQEDWLEKAGAMFAGLEFDTRVQVPLNLEKDELYKLMTMAHERDVTLNKMVEIILHGNPVLLLMKKFVLKIISQVIGNIELI